MNYVVVNKIMKANNTSNGLISYSLSVCLNKLPVLDLQRIHNLMMNTGKK